jgi:uncharacterized protein
MKIKKTIIIGLLLGTTYLQAQISESKLFLEALVKGDYSTSYSLFDTVISKEISLEKLGTTWTGLQSQVGTYKGHSDLRLEENSTTYTTCQFEKMELDLKLVYTSENKIKGFFFVPSKPKVAYHKPTYDNEANYTEKDVLVKTNNYSLPATLTLPKGKKYIPFIILVHGSGPNDKDETIGPNKVFRDLAVGLAANGIATLRYDKRTKVYAKDLKADSVTIKEETIEDALSAIKMASTFSEIDKSQIYLLGHSLGGMCAPEIVSENTNLKGIILLAANARPLEDLISIVS